MTVVSGEPDGNSTAVQRERRQSGAAVRAELTESPAGWSLVLHCDAATAAVLRAGGVGVGATDAMSVSISPNLVPGEPFAVEQVSVVVDAAPPQQRSSRRR